MLRLICAVFLIAASFSASANWSYREQEDQMSGRSVKYASIQSRNQIKFGAPYGGAQRATLSLRIHPRYGRDAILSIPRGQFLCGMDGCSMLVRMDMRAAEQFRAAEPSDRSTNTIFIQDYSRFLSGVKTAKLLRVEVKFYQEGARVFEFDVAGLNWEDIPRPKPKVDPNQEENEREKPNKESTNTVDEYKRRISEKIQRFIVKPPNVSNNAEVEFEIVILTGGEVQSAKLKRSSNSVPAYDSAVERAILKAQPLPLPPDPAALRQLREINLVFRPDSS